MDGKKITVRQSVILIFISTFLLGFAAHAFRYFNLSFSHDSVSVFQNDALWQVSLGRFLQPVYLLLRGQLSAPFLIGLFSLVWLALAICLVAALLEIKSPAAIVLICGMLSTNIVLSAANATYILWSDIYMLALLFSVLSVYLLKRYKLGFLPGALSVLIVLALYQSYFEVAVSLSLILLIKDCFDRLSTKEIFIRGIKAFSMLLIGLALYFGCLKVVLALTGVDLSASYNGIAGIGDYSETSILRLLGKTYTFYGKYVFSPTTFHPVLAVVINIVIFALSGMEFVIISVRRKLQKHNILFLIAFIALLPLGMNIVYFISNGLKHTLMAFSFFFVYVLALLTLEYSDENISVVNTQSKSSKLCLRRNWARIIMTLGIGILILNNIIYANHLYLKKELEYQATLSTLTRVVDRMEQTEGYVVNKTPIIIVGLLSDSELAADRPGFEYLWAAGMGVESNTSVTYLSTYSTFFSNILGYPVNLILDTDTINEYTDLQEVKSMPVFPGPGSCIMINGVLVVKFS